MNASIQPSSPRPGKRISRRLIVLLVAFGLLLAIYRPMRVLQADDLLRRSLLNSEFDGVRTALDSGADPNLQLTPDVPMGGFATLKAFLNILLPSHASSIRGNAKTALMLAAGNSDTKLLHTLLQHGADVNRRLENGNTALLYAAPKSSPEILQTLLANGANIHVQTKEGATPLLLAARTGQIPNMRLLLAAGAGIHAADHHSQTALAIAVENRQEEMVRFLLSQGAGAADLRPAYLAAVHARPVGAGQPGALTPALANSMSILPPWVRPVDVRPPPKRLPRPPLTPLGFAAQHGSLALVQFLWERTAPEDRHKEGWDLLCKAAASESIPTVQFLLDQHVPVNRSAASRPGHTESGFDVGIGNTPLHNALQTKPGVVLPLTTLLIAHGADINVENALGETPLMLAAARSSKTILLMLIAHGANLNATDHWTGRNALMHGIDNEQTVRLLLDHGTDINARNRQGKTALLQCSRPGVATLLISRGANVNARDAAGNTALMQVYNTPLVTALLAHGAKVDTRNKQGETPLLIAMQYGGTIDVISLLLQHGANLNAADKKGDTPLILAQRKRDPYIMAVLTSTGPQH